jgi:hypothetical protein
LRAHGLTSTAGVMGKLEDILPDGLVTVVDVQWFHSEALELAHLLVSVLPVTVVGPVPHRIPAVCEPTLPHQPVLLLPAGDPIAGSQPAIPSRLVRPQEKTAAPSRKFAESLVLVIDDGFRAVAGRIGVMHPDDAPVITPLILTDHARKRAQSRGVSLRILEAIYTNANCSPFVGNGCRSLTVSRRLLARLADNIPAADRERMDGVVLVVDPKSNAIHGIACSQPERSSLSAAT